MSPKLDVLVLRGLVLRGRYFTIEHPWASENASPSIRTHHLKDVEMLRQRFPCTGTYKFPNDRGASGAAAQCCLADRHAQLSSGCFAEAASIFWTPLSSQYQCHIYSRVSHHGSMDVRVMVPFWHLPSARIPASAGC